MHSAPEPACLVIADISGYTGYMAGVELDHAQDILGAVPEPELPTSGARFQTEPVRNGQPALASVESPSSDSSSG